MLEAASEGHDIVNVGDAIAFGGFYDDGRPILAIARADRKQVRVYKSWRLGPTLTFDAHATSGQGPQSETLVREVTRREIANHQTRTGYATVPMAPPKHRPPTGQLRDWFVLWEVDQWHDRPVTDPPFDPWLLKHIEGDFYQVLACWDLTELERAAMQLAAFRVGGPRQ